MGESKHVLHFDTRISTLRLGGRTLPLRLRDQRLIGLVALAFQEGTGSVEVRTFERALGWQGVGNLANAASRLLKRLAAQGAPVIHTASGQKTVRWNLNRELVAAVTTDLPTVTAFREWVCGVAAPLRADTIQAARLLVLAQTAFEQGHYPEAERHAEAAFLADPSPDQHLRALAMLAWVRTVCGTHAQGQAAVREMLLHLERYQREAVTCPSREVEALVHIQAGRFYMRKMRAHLARRAYGRAAKLFTAGHHREWGSVEAGMGYLAQQAGQLDQASRRYEDALGHFTQAQWHWAMHVQYNNLAAVHFERYERDRQVHPSEALAALERAVEWSVHARTFAHEMHFGGSIDIEVNLAFAYRVQGRLVDAELELRRAEATPGSSSSVSDRALIAAERAELAEAQGQRDLAVALWREALRYLRAAGITRWVVDAERRLAALDGHAANTGALKLW